GDVLSLVEEVERSVDRDQAERMADKFKKGQGFDLEDFRDQMQQIKRMGGLGSLMDKMPGMGQMSQQVGNQLDDGQVRRQVAIIDSMTPDERRRPDVINGSRKRRIAAGAGIQVQDVNRLLKQHKQMQKMMKQLKKGGMKKMMRQFGGGMPPGLGGR
ncbi:MAG: signal recognition particle protein, partial [Gammaproteobacteria bacterium]|nr:signal recognition particle protein [Gammaproteobacteria bacterium]